MKIFNTLLILCLSSVVLAQNTEYPKPILSAATKQYLWMVEKQHLEKPVQLPQYVFRQDALSNTYVSAIIKVQPGFSEAALTNIGVHIGTKAGNIWTAQVPLNNVKNFCLVNGIKCIDMDQASCPALDTARKATRVDSVHSGYGLPQPYSGENVVIGIIDAGFDYTHPTLYDSAYSAYRVKRVWEEKNTTGTPPPGYFYGSEYADSTTIFNKANDIISGSHGSHVSGIAAGSGNGSSASNKRFRGMAYKSDLVFVGIYPSAAYWLNTGMTDMLDGINYVFNYAASVNKPAVANLSWGCPIGPRDGSSLFSQACDNLTGPGKIFVLSGGNNGANNIHLQKTFTPTDTLVSTVVTFSASLTDKKNLVDIWGDSSKIFCLKFSLYTGNTKIDSSMYFCLDDSTHQINLIGSNGDTCFVTLTSVADEFNGKPHMLLNIYSRVGDKLCLTLKSSSGIINMWQGFVLKTSGYYGLFSNGSFSWAVNGNNLMTTGDLPSTRSAIAVGAYNSKPNFINVSGASLGYTGYTKGAISSFSSKGPTVDGRAKPNITGPGLALASSVNSFDSTYMAGGPSYNSVISTYLSSLNGKTYSYAMSAGTSMSSPAVSGIVALLLEANPLLSPQDVMDVLYQTAIHDSYTGTIPPTGSNVWGFGKVNAYRAIMQILNITGIYHQETLLNCLLYPNPGKGNYNIEYVGENSETLQIDVSDAAGHKIMHEKWFVYPGNNTHHINLSGFAEGIYFTQITGKAGRTTVKIIKQ